MSWNKVCDLPVSRGRNRRHKKILITGFAEKKFVLK